MPSERRASLFVQGSLRPVPLYVLSLAEDDAAVRAQDRRLGFVLKRHLHQDSLEGQTRLPGSLSTEW
jgi:hypothetical protein